MRIELRRKIFEKRSNVKFNEIPSSMSRFFGADGRTDRQTDITMPIFTSGNFAKAPKKNINALALELDIYSLALPWMYNENILWTKKGNIRKYTTFCGGINEDGDRNSKK